MKIVTFVIASVAAYTNTFQEEAPDENLPFEGCSAVIDALELGIQNSVISSFNGTQFEGQGLELITNTPRKSLIGELFDKVSDWKSLGDFDNPQAQLFNGTSPGPAAKPQDIKQGMIKDSFFVAAVQSMALDEQLIRSLVLEQPANSAVDPQQYKFKFYANGDLYDIVVDDEVPIFKPIADANYEYFLMSEPVQNIFWGSLLEKAYAKFVGSYERLSKGGSASEVTRAILGYPTFEYDLSSDTIDTFLLIKTAIDNKDIVTASTNFRKRTVMQENQNIQTHQVYSVLGYIKLNETSSKVPDPNLIYIRNPWAEEHYEGPHVEPLSLNENQRNQILGEHASWLQEGDGEYLVSETDFTESFSLVEIGRKLPADSWSSSLKVGSPYKSAMHTFFLTAMETGMHYVSLDTWYHRMYRRGCAKGLTIFKVELYDNYSGRLLEELDYFDQSGTKSILVDMKARIEYKMVVKIDWHEAATSLANVRQEFTLMIQGPGLTLIKDMAAEKIDSLRPDTSKTWVQEKVEKVKKWSRWVRNKLNLSQNYDPKFQAAQEFQLYSEFIQEFGALQVEKGDKTYFLTKDLGHQIIACAFKLGDGANQVNLSVNPESSVLNWIGNGANCNSEHQCSCAGNQACVFVVETKDFELNYNLI